MARNIYFVIAYARFTNDIITHTNFTALKDAEQEARDYIKYSNVGRVEVLKNESMFEVFGREEGDRRAIKIKDGIVSTIRL